METLRPRVVTRRYLASAPRMLEASSAVPDSYIQRLVKYIPAEVTAAYLVVLGFLKGPPDKLGFPPAISEVWHWGVFVAFMILAVLYTMIATKRAGLPDIQWFQVVAAPVALAAWVFAFGGPFEASFGWYRPPMGSIILVLTSLLIPAVDELLDAAAPK
jgi:hypothetical protein